MAADSQSDSLGGARVALLESRMESELASLVKRHGGDPVCVPALREVARDCAPEVARAIDALSTDDAIVVLATGVGVDRWFVVADGLGRGDALHQGLARATVICRGPKPVAALKRRGLTAHLRAPAPHTTAELLDVLAGVDVHGHHVAFVHDGGPGRVVPEALEARGARVHELRSYEWALPEDVGPLQELVRAIVKGELRAIAITTQVQARHLFDVAESIRARAELADALRKRVVVAAVGPTCERALRELGVAPHVVPTQSKMGPLVLALAAHLTRSSPETGETAPTPVTGKSA